MSRPLDGIRLLEWASFINGPGAGYMLGDLGAEVVRGDVTEPATLEPLVAGQQVVVHAASRIADWGPRAEFFRTPQHPYAP